MCECGCSMGNPMYRLPIDKATCYVIELYGGCYYCAAAPAIIVRKVAKESVYWDELQDTPAFPLARIDGREEWAIKCGLDPDEFRNAAVTAMKGAEVEGGKIDEVVADILAEDLWKQVLRRRPQVVAYKSAGAGAKGGGGGGHG